MMLDATVRARIDSGLKNEVEAIFHELGLTTSQAITLFLKKVKIERGIPFELKIPNETTIKAMNEAKNLEGETCSLEEFIK
ncbi:MAG: type II toxin-antitoxin system RelB/DinJ family antitoxin [Sulfurimonas sp.]|jgi:DNA-damage-inducible protein J|uniref:type II toxin-antitoxin system RelB/DinJ family antitoxin n=1 Tax=Sulfurimonas sp. TaxID=2022749 RepID=UPI003563932E